jgi:site-specific DNA-adenine methylase
MRLYDYKFSPVSDRRKWMETVKISSGLGYFGGKQFIGKYLMNRLFNMAARMEDDGNKADIFIDAFTGGGKIGLSVPEGWFDTIVINDLDYGVVSYFEACRDKPDRLVKLIEEIGSCMCEYMFNVFVNNRCNSSALAIRGIKKDYNNEDWISDEIVEPLLAGAMTYWVVQSEFNGCTAPGKANYSLKIGDKDEKEEIRNIIELAKKRIPKVHDIIKKRNVIIESLDYRELIKKYNGKPYKDSKETEQPEDKAMSKKNKLWYFDPPYHPATLFGGENAPYMVGFPIELVHEMTGILHNDRMNEFGEIKYFIKSDYNPKYRYEEEYVAVKKDIALLQELQNAYHDFDVLEENDKNSTQYEDKDIEYYVECIGDFGKGANDNEGKAQGREYIWCRGNYQGEESSNWKYNGTGQLK